EQWTPEEAKIFQQGNTLAKVIEANTGVTNLQSNVFLFKASISGIVYVGQSTSGSHSHPGRSLSGVTVELEDTNGNVLAMTVTDSRAHYISTQLTGVSPAGDSLGRLVVPTGITQPSATPATIAITRSDTNVRGVNFALATTGQSTTTTGTQTAAGGSMASTSTGLDPSAVDVLFAGVAG